MKNTLAVLQKKLKVARQKAVAQNKVLVKLYTIADKAEDKASLAEEYSDELWDKYNELQEKIKDLKTKSSKEDTIRKIVREEIKKLTKK